MTDKQPEQSQVDKFRELARELDVDLDETIFEDAVRKVATAQPQKPSGD